MVEFEGPMTLGRGAETPDPISRLLFDQAVMSACLVDCDLRIVAVNGPWSAGLREKPENLVGRLLTDVAPWISERWLGFYENALAGECISVHEEKLALPTGVIYCTMQIMPWRVDGQIKGAMCFAQDVTGYVNARALSEAYERRLEVALEIFGAAVCEVDRAARTMTWHGDPVAIYGRVLTLSDLNPEKSSLYLEEERTQRVKLFDESARADKFDMEGRMVRPNGDVFWVQSSMRHYRDADGKLQRTIMISKDVTVRKREEEAFIEAMRRAEAALDAKRALLGDAPAPHQDAMPPPDMASNRVAEMFVRLARLLAEIDVRDAALSEALEAMRAAREAAESANVSKSQFLANMSHELRTPLNAIIGYSEILLEDALADGRDGDAKDNERVLEAARHLLHLINDILDLSKIEAGRMELVETEFDVRSFIDATVDTVRPAAERNGNSLRVMCSPDLGVVHSDMLKLRQCLLNLLSNAVKFTREGEVSLQVERLQSGDVEWIEFRVRDTGIGMSEEQLVQLFQPFTQADASIARTYGGTGLGLSITQHMAQALGGDVSVQSRLGEGSEFVLRAPTRIPVKKNIARAPAAPVAAPAPAHEGRSVVIIDDDDSARDLAFRALSRLGFSVRAAATGAAGRALVREIAPVLVLLDIQLPDESGWSVIAQLKADPATAGIPVIVHSVEDDRASAMAAGACHVLVKPVDRDLMAQAVARFAHPPANLEAPQAASARAAQI